MKIRDDVFPNYCSIFSSKEQYVKANLRITCEAFSSVFSSMGEVISLFNGIKETKKAELLLQLSRYYNISKKYAKHDFLKVVMIISLIERLASQEEQYLDFKEWITQKGVIEENLKDNILSDTLSVRKFIQRKKDEYHSKYGSVKNFAEFLDRYLDLDEKIQFIRSLKPKYTEYLVQYSELLPHVKPWKDLNEAIDVGKIRHEKGLVPLCYSWRQCLMDGSDCQPWDPKMCNLHQNPAETSKTLRKVSSIFYGLRSEFVHLAKPIPIGGQEPSVGTLAKYRGKPIVVKLTVKYLEEVFEEAFKKYFEDQAK